MPIIPLNLTRLTFSLHCSYKIFKKMMPFSGCTGIKVSKLFKLCFLQMQRQEMFLRNILVQEYQTESKLWLSMAQLMYHGKTKHEQLFWQLPFVPKAKNSIKKLELTSFYKLKTCCAPIIISCSIGLFVVIQQF